MALDSGALYYEAVCDLTAATKVALGCMSELVDIVEVGIVYLTAGTTTAAAVEFHDQVTASATGPTLAAATLFATVTAPSIVAAQAAGQVVQKIGINKRFAKGDRLWACVKTTATAASDARVYARGYPAGQSALEAKCTNSST